MDCVVWPISIDIHYEDYKEKESPHRNEAHGKFSIGCLMPTKASSAK